jgi:hypothetical protein
VQDAAPRIPRAARLQRSAAHLVLVVLSLYVPHESTNTDWGGGGGSGGNIEGAPQNICPQKIIAPAEAIAAAAAAAAIAALT